MTGGGEQATIIWLFVIGCVLIAVWAEAADTVPASAAVAASVNIRDPMDVLL
jgi:hypothetical protein